jgi:hypothetical protein
MPRRTLGVAHLDARRADRRSSERDDCVERFLRRRELDEAVCAALALLRLRQSLRVVEDLAEDHHAERAAQLCQTRHGEVGR